MMNKTELILKVVEEVGLSKVDATKAVEACFEAITSSLSKKNEVHISGFGTFRVSKREARQGRNPATGKIIMIPSTVVPIFIAGIKLRRAVNTKFETGKLSKESQNLDVNSIFKPSIEERALNLNAQNNSDNDPKDYGLSQSYRGSPNLDENSTLSSRTNLTENYEFSSPDIHQIVTNQIIEAIEMGVEGNHQMPWHLTEQGLPMPISVKTGKPYRGNQCISFMVSKSG